MKDILIVIFSLSFIVGCDSSDERTDITKFDSEKMEAISISKIKYRKLFLEDLKNRSISYKEMTLFGSDNLYIVTWKEDADEVNQAYSSVIGERPGYYSISPFSSDALEDIKLLFEKNSIEFNEGHFYGVDYISWNPSDNKLARVLIENVMGPFER